MEEGTEEIVFDSTEALYFQRAFMQQIYGTEADNIIGRRNKEGNFPVMPSGQNINLVADNKAIIHCIGIKIDKYNDNVPKNTPEKKDNNKGTKKSWQGGETRGRYLTSEIEPCLEIF